MLHGFLRLVLVYGLAAMCTLYGQSQYVTPYAFRTLAGKPTHTGSADGIGSQAEFFYPSGIAVVSAGVFYIADTNNHTIRKVVNGNQVVTIAGEAGRAGADDGPAAHARFNQPSDIAVDSAGNVFVADFGNNSIRRIATDGTVSTYAGINGSAGSEDGPGAIARFYHPADVAVDSAGNLLVADYGNHTIRRISNTGMVSTIAGLAGAIDYIDGPAGQARFWYPCGLTLDESDNIIVADAGNHRIRKISNTGVVTTLGVDANNSWPGDVALDEAGNVYFTDRTNGQIKKVAPGGVISSVAGNPYLSSDVKSGADGTGLEAEFEHPRGIAMDFDGNLLVADVFDSAIRKVTPAGVVTTVAGAATTAGTTDGTGATARFSRPAGIAVDQTHNVYVADSRNYTVRKISSTGLVTTFAGSAGISGSADGIGPEARFYAPGAIAVDQAGNLFVTDGGNHTIRKISSQGVVTTIAGAAGITGSADGPGALARFNGPAAIAVDSSGNVFVSDYNNNTVRRISPEGIVSTVAGMAGSGGYADGQSDSARFWGPMGIAIDGAGNLIVADQRNASIRKITGVGVVTTQAGDVGTPWYTDGVGIAAYFNRPDHVAVDAAGYVYVADSGNYLIRRISPEGVVTTLAGLAEKSGTSDGTGPDARFTLPVGLTVDSVGRLYVTDMSSNTVRVGVAAPPVDLENWISRDPLSPAVTLWSITKAGDQLVAVGNHGTIRTSEDGIHWMSLSSGSTQFLAGAAWSGSRYVVVGDFGTILTSPNGFDWTVCSSGTAQTLREVVWTSGRFVAVGSNGTILTSPDGDSWTIRNSGTTEYLINLMWTGDQYLATGVHGSSLTSPDGIVWTTHSSDENHSVSGVVWGGGQFVAVGPSGTILTSLDGSEWTVRDSGTTENLVEVTWGGGQYVAVGWNGTILTSPDGVVWTLRTSGSIQVLASVIWDDGQFVVVGLSGTILTSFDGINWTERSVSSSVWLYDVTWNGSQYVVVGDKGTILTSSNGIAWAKRLSGINVDLKGLFERDGYYVAVGKDGTMLTSTNGFDWTAYSTGTHENLNDVVLVNSEYVVVGENGAILTSENAVDWTVLASGTQAVLTSVAWSGRKCVAVGFNGAILTSDYGWTPWAPVASGTSEHLYSVTWHYDQFVAVGTGGIILTSPDGITWTSRSSGTSAWLDDVIWDGGQLVAVGAQGTILTSPDGVSWTGHASGLTQELIGVARSGGQFVLIGRDDTLLTTATLPLITAQPLTQTIAVGQSATFSVANQSSDRVGYQWHLNGNVIAGAVSGTYTIPAGLSANAGSYIVMITNTSGTVTSNAATLTVTGQSQSIDFATVNDQAFTLNPITLVATATSGLPVSFSVVSGPAVVSSNNFFLNGVGLVTIRANQAGGDGYLAATPAERSLVIRKNYAYWQFTHFTPDELAMSSISGPNAVVGYDGIPNLVKYALGMDSGSVTDAGIPTLSTDGTNWIYTFTCPSEITDVTSAVQCSEDMADWFSDGITMTLLSIVSDTETWQATYPLDTAPNLFFRLQVTLVE